MNAFEEQLQVLEQGINQVSVAHAECHDAIKTGAPLVIRLEFLDYTVVKLHKQVAYVIKQMKDIE